MEQFDSDIVDALIADVYDGVARSAPFIKACLQKGKTRMHQLDESDFEAAGSLRGLGAASVEALYDIYSRHFQEGAGFKHSVTVLPISPEMSIDLIFDGQPHGELLMRHCHMEGFHTMADLKEFSFLPEDVRGIGVASMEQLRRVYIEALRHMHLETGQGTVFPIVSVINRPLKLSALEILGYKAAAELCRSDELCTVGDLCLQPLSMHDYFLLKPILSFVAIPVTEHFERELYRLKDVALDGLLKKSRGVTLQSIADEFDITRERVRQIIMKSVQLLMPYAELVAQALQSTVGELGAASLQLAFRNEISAHCCSFVLRESTGFHYFTFSDKFINVSYCPTSIDVKLQLFASEVIGHGLNFYDNLERIEDELVKRQLGFLDFEDVTNYLVQMGYRFYGDYVTKGRIPYSVICHDAIAKYFSFDIKLDADEENGDMNRLREIVEKHYQGLVIPENNRALTAGITRQNSLMILSGRGRYCPIEKVIYTPMILEKIYEFIDESAQTSFYYNELFVRFEESLRSETNVSNPNFLHGILMYVYPDAFIYERDLLVKNGEARSGINDRLCELISSKGSAMSREELKRELPGINDFMIAFTVGRLPNLIQWDYNCFNHMDNIPHTQTQVSHICDLIEKEIQMNRGYMSEAMLFSAVQRELPQFVSESGIENSLNLYFVVASLLEGVYRFRRPHILAKDFPVENLSVANIAKTLLGCGERLHYIEYIALANSVGWAEGTQYAVFVAIEREFVRIDEDNYVSRHTFFMEEYTLQLLGGKIRELLEGSGYCALSSISSYAGFPECGYEWNAFLLSSILQECQFGFKIISPQARNRRYLRGIILQDDSACNSFEDVVIESLKKEGIESLTEGELFAHLKTHGLMIKMIPQELYECERMPYKNDLFVIR